MSPTVPDGPDTELAAAIERFREQIEATPVGHAVRLSHVTAALILDAVLARPAVARTDGQCTCGDPSAADLVHHTEAPCRTVEELRTGRTDGQPHPDPRGRYDVPDPYDHPGWPLVSRIVAIATDTAPTMPNETDGVDNAVTGLLADQSWRDHVAMADVMGLVGDWGTDDVVQAVTDALHEYPRLRALVARTDGQPPADDPPPPSPDPRGDGLCPNCPTDLATLDSGHGVCMECGWTSDPGKCMELYNRIDELVAVARSVVDLVDRTVDMPGFVRDVVDNLRDALSAASADDTAAAPAPWMVESRDERVDRLTRHVENVADCAGIEIEVREAGPLTGPAPLRRLVRALEGAGMLHDDPADDTAAPDPRPQLRSVVAELSGLLDRAMNHGIGVEYIAQRRETYMSDLRRAEEAVADESAAADRITAVKLLLDATTDPMDRAEAETHLDILGVTRAEVDEAKRLTAGQPVRGSQTEAES